MGLARRDRGVRRRRCRGASPTTRNDEIARNPHAPSGFRRRAGMDGVAAPGPCAAAWPAARRLAAAGTALGTRPMLLLGHAPRGGTLTRRVSPAGHSARLDAPGGLQRRLYRG